MGGFSYWPHQDRFHAANQAAVVDGVKAFVNCSPCGSGKTAMMMRVITGAVSKGRKVAVYSCRTANTGQIIEACKKAGIDFGVIAAEYASATNPEAMVQICQLQTVAARMNTSKMLFPVSDYVLVDEAHQQTGDQAKEVLEWHKNTGTKAIIGYTATPVNCGELYQKVIECVTFKELIDVKAHLPAEYYGPDRPDFTGAVTTSSGEYSTKTNERLNPVKAVFGNILKNYHKYNPQQLPAILFAASVKHSRGHAYEFMKHGISAAHIDGERVLMTVVGDDGNLDMREYPSDNETRARVLDGSRTGEFKVVCNRFVLREAVDMPWLYHAIIACSMGGVSTYLQSVGRVLRYHPDYSKVIVQDHGGNIDRHGLCDEEGRDWSLGCTNKSIQKDVKRKRENTQGQEAEPICCPKCNGMRSHGSQCPYCGHMHTMSVKLVRQDDGTLVRKTGRTVKYKGKKSFDDYLRSALYAAHASGGTVKQAYYIARAKALGGGIKVIKPISIWTPPNGDSRWNLSVRHVYPQYKPRRKE